MKKNLIGSILALTCLSAVAGQNDVIRLDAALPPDINASEDTPVSYVGAVPPTFTAALDADDSTFNRPVTCATLSGLGTAVPFDTVTITNNAGVAANFTVTSSLVGGGACGDANDTFFALYSTFNPAAGLSGCLAVSDDISSATNRCSTLTFNVPAGQSRVVVTTGFNNATEPTGLFPYQVSFVGTDVLAVGTLSVGAPIVDFNRQLVGSAITRLQTLSNTGTGALTISALTAPTAPFGVGTGGTCSALPITLAAGASCTVAYAFSPTAEGQFSQVISATSNGGNLTYTLRGQSVSSIQLPITSDAGRVGLILLLAGLGLWGLRRRA